MVSIDFVLYGTGELKYLDPIIGGIGVQVAVDDDAPDSGRDPDGDRDTVVHPDDDGLRSLIGVDLLVVVR